MITFVKSLLTVLSAPSQSCCVHEIITPVRTFVLTFVILEEICVDA